MSTKNQNHTPRFIQPEGSVVEITSRALQRRFLLRPGRVANEIIVGCLARARQAHPEVKIFAAVFLSNHFHLLLWVPDARTMAAFVGHLKTNLSKKLGKLHRWKGPMFHRRYDHAILSAEEEAQVARLRYLLAHGLKEDLVPRPQDWPGVHCAHSLATGEPLRGFWFDDTEACKARIRNERKLHRYSHGEAAEIVFDKLPCWAHLRDTAYRSKISAILADLQVQHDRRRHTEGIRLPSITACRKKLQRQDPHGQPESVEKPRAKPRFHAITRKERRKLEEMLAGFLRAYRAAAERLRAGKPGGQFPAGCFPSPVVFQTAGST